MCRIYLKIWFFEGAISAIAVKSSHSFHWVFSEGHKNYFEDWCFMNSQPIIQFSTYSQLNELWQYYQKDVKPDNFESDDFE